MNKVRTLTIISIGMLAANLVLIWFVILHTPPHVGDQGPKNIIIERLRFDEAQEREYQKLINFHRNSVRETTERTKTLKLQLYLTLKQGENNNLTDSLITEIGKTQQAIEKANYSHFLELRKLCKPDQLNSYDALSADIVKLFSKTPPPSW
jgi:protein CpxP